MEKENQITIDKKKYIHIKLAAKLAGKGYHAFRKKKHEGEVVVLGGRYMPVDDKDNN